MAYVMTNKVKPYIYSKLIQYEIRLKARSRKGHSMLEITRYPGNGWR